MNSHVADSQTMNKINKNYEDIRWYHGKLSREEADKVLMQDGRGDGLFLVRESHSSTGDYVLSVLHKDQVSHFQIRRHAEDAFFSMDKCLKFHGLEVLIEHYTVTPNVLSGDLVLTEYVVKYPPPPDSRRHGRTNLLHRATHQGNYTVVSELLKTDYPHDAKNQDGQTAAHLASMTGKNDILMKLIESGASVNLRDSAGFTPLHTFPPPLHSLLWGDKRFHILGAMYFNLLSSILQTKKLDTAV